MSTDADLKRALEKACREWVEQALIQKEDEPEAIQSLAALVREQVEKQIKSSHYEEVVDLHRQYGREVRLRDVCRWLVTQVDPGPGPRYVHPYLKLADALREHFAKEDEEYDHRDDVRCFEARIAALEAQQESDHAWIDADAKTKEAQQNEIAELEAALEKADALLERSKTFIAGSVSGTHHPSHNPLWSDIREHFRAKTRKP